MLVAKLLLETSLAINFQTIVEKDGKEFTSFTFPNYVYVKRNGDCIPGALHVEINLSDCEMINASFGGNPLAPNDTLVHLVFYWSPFSMSCYCQLGGRY